MDGRDVQKNRLKLNGDENRASVLYRSLQKTGLCSVVVCSTLHTAVFYEALILTTEIAIKTVGSLLNHPFNAELAIYCVSNFVKKRVRDIQFDKI